MYELLITFRGQVLGRVELPDGVLEIGRDIGSDLVLEDECVSRHHARVLVIGERVLLEDLHSGNGTFVGGVRVAQKELQHGDRILIEPFELELRSDLSETHPGVEFVNEYTVTDEGAPMLLAPTPVQPVWRQPRVLITAAAVMVFGLFAAVAIFPPDAPAPEPELSSLQRTILDNARQSLADARELTAAKSHAEAVPLYERAVRYAQRPELAGISAAEELAVQASRETLMAHELAASQRIQDTLEAEQREQREREKRTAAEQAAFDKKLATAQLALRRAHTSATQKPSVESWQAVERTASRVISLKPSDEVASRQRRQARSFLKDHHRMEVLQLVSRAEDLSATTNARELHVALTLLERVAAIDPDDTEGTQSNAQRVRRNVEVKLKHLAAPHLRAGRVALQRRDYLTARDELSTAANIDRADTETARLLADAKRECARIAETLLIEAKVHRANKSDTQVRKTCTELFKYDPDPQGRYHQKCEELVRSLPPP